MNSPTSSKIPGTWKPARAVARRVMAPVEAFLAIQSASGVLLLAMAILALVWANSSYSHYYEALWHLPLGLRFGEWSFERDLHFWINDGLMTIFFFVVGLEIRREIHRGELSELRRATLPLAAALGGMAIPALLYLAFNLGRPSVVGWGVPMATDIAFAIGVLALLGKRVPPALRVLLLALAVIDDIGAIIVIALFYSSGIEPMGFVTAAGGILGIFAMQAVGVRSPWFYVIPSVVAWAGTYYSGVHPTIAGVLVGLLTPVKPRYNPFEYLEVAQDKIASIPRDATQTEEALIPHLDSIRAAARESISPVERLQHALHGWVSFGIMPLFALANAGVAPSGAVFDDNGIRLFVGIAVGLVVGKPVGIVAMSWIACRIGWTSLPRGLQWRHIFLVGMCAGIGFTMAIFISQLAFESGPMLETAKLAILCASAAAGVIALGIGHKMLPDKVSDDAAKTDLEAESSSLV